ncbi:hypothetical protein HDIA_1843 [Hartmannibacter diazotrophicus]|uniref:Uncharacterized protein n=1 Tax=Hartmannibacter diazotrophicus TaxID=1482074 RepID=A0A2C9D4Z8_9HYPH|nr:hypothetical protein [Hartmannibacter diazotrophicus]SON55384.1 hypothetical protein HDIA_1843 [Hartmannibacter diazotrophicus]
MMKHALALGLLLVPAGGHAQSGSMDPAHMTHQHSPAATLPHRTDIPREPGQDAFAAIQEIVDLLMRDPETDWTKVDIPALRAHLIDMNNVTLRADVTAKPIPDGLEFQITGPAEIAASARRMVSAHAATMNGTMGYTYDVRDIPHGAALIARAEDDAALERLHGLGFIGLMTLGAHHQEHHLAIARGASPHQ